ncbi:MAG: DUF1638 domain-containing protein, partial [FCB group bacterium]|nr:DUF1638 domain-containing protein [FCB group bacterium]
MVTETFLIVCENVYEEFKVAVDLEGFDDTVVSSYPSTCGNPQLGWSALEKVLAESPDCKYIDIVGGCCISHLENRSDEGPPLTIHKLPHDLNLFADASLINSYIQKGVYMMTPGWLNRWQHWIDRWGFDQKLAREFFAEHNKKLVLLDTGIYSNSLQELQNISEFLNQPFEILPVGLQQLRLFLTKIVLNNRLKNEQHKSELNLAEAQKQISDYAMVVDLLMNLVRTTHEADTIRQIIDLFSMMFSAKELLYISFVNNQPQLV